MHGCAISGGEQSRLQQEDLNVKRELCHIKARARLRLLTPLQVPSALLTFSWDAAVLADIRAAGVQPDSSVLKPELLSAIKKL